MSQGTDKTSKEDEYCDFFIAYPGGGEGKCRLTNEWVICNANPKECPDLEETASPVDAEKAAREEQLFFVGIMPPSPLDCQPELPVSFSQPAGRGSMDFTVLFEHDHECMEAGFLPRKVSPREADIWGEVLA